MLHNLKRITIDRTSVPEAIGTLYCCNEYRWINDIGTAVETNSTSESDVIEFAVQKAKQYNCYADPTLEEIARLNSLL